LAALHVAKDSVELSGIPNWKYTSDLGEPALRFLQEATGLAQDPQLPFLKQVRAMHTPSTDAHFPFRTPQSCLSIFLLATKYPRPVTKAKAITAKGMRFFMA
jgi:hypothetical protein